MSAIVQAEQRYAIEELIYRTCLALDAQDYKAFLELCDADFRYTITTYSPEEGIPTLRMGPKPGAATT